MVMSIDILSDDALLEIFGFYVVEDIHVKRDVEAWQSLVHVCQRWRRLVFGSPRCLNLRLYCATKTQTRMRDTLDIWPALPLIIRGSANPEELDNIIAVLERNDRVCDISIDFSDSHFGDAWTVMHHDVMQKPFPVLERLGLSASGMTPDIPDSILGGSAPHLIALALDGFPFPGIPKLLMSTTHLMHLSLTNYSSSRGYISPEAIVNVLSTLTSLRSLSLGFSSSENRPDQHPSPLTRPVIPFLRLLKFNGVSGYLEDLLARFDTPRLSTIYIILPYQIVFDTQTIQFIRRTRSLGPLEEARLVFRNADAEVCLSSRTSGFEQIRVGIPFEGLDWQISSVRLFIFSLPLLSKLKDLYIFEETYSPPHWKDKIENVQWLELLCPFITVKNLYLSEKFAPRIVSALQELVGDRARQVLPALQNLFLEGTQPSGPVQESIAKFISTRQLSGHPVTVSLWERATFRSSRAIRP